MASILLFAIASANYLGLTIHTDVTCCDLQHTVDTNEIFLSYFIILFGTNWYKLLPNKLLLKIKKIFVVNSFLYV